MIAWSVHGAGPAQVTAGAEDSYTAAATAVLDATRAALLSGDRTAVYPGRYTLCLDGEQVAVLAVGRTADGQHDRTGALAHLERIEHALIASIVTEDDNQP